MDDEEQDPDHLDRLDAELALLGAMYPDCVTYAHQGRGLRQGQGQGLNREVHYISRANSASSPCGYDADAGGGDIGGDIGGSLILRLPSLYPSQGLPELLSARAARFGAGGQGGNHDLLFATQRAIEGLDLHEGVEVLDQIVGCFEGVLAEARAAETTSTKVPVPVSEPVPAPVAEGGGEGGDPDPDPGSAHASQQGKTVVVWLHHLLATSKRKLALHPAVTTSGPSPSSATNPDTPSSSISGITKPGYPGILVFAGPSELVDAHVRSLKALNWQAFQVRYDSALDSSRPLDTPTIREEARDAKDKDQDKDKGANKKANARSSVKGNPKHVHSPLHDHGEEWQFSHPKGKIIEVESMAELVRAIVREVDRDIFLRAVGVK